MFVVITNGVVSYAGPSQQDAITTLGSQPGSAMHNVETYDQIEQLLSGTTPESVYGFAGQSTKKPVDEPKSTNLFDDAVKMVEFTAAVSDTFQSAMKKLDELGVNDKLVDNVVKKTESLVGEVRSLGVKGMQTVGESFIALGDLLKNIDEPKTK